MARDAKGRKGSGARRKFKGRTGTPVKVMGKVKVVPRSHTHGGGSPARAGFYECGQNQPWITRLVPGRFRVAMPNKLTKKGGEFS